MLIRSIVTCIHAYLISADVAATLDESTVVLTLGGMPAAVLGFLQTKT